METETKSKFKLIWIGLLSTYAFILFIYQMSFRETTTIVFSGIYVVFVIIVFLFLKGVKDRRTRYLYIGAILSIIFNLIVIVVGISYVNNQRYEDFQRKQILLTGASDAYEALNLDSQHILSVEVDEYTKGDGFPFRYKVKITTSEGDQPYYFECSNYECRTMIRNNVIEK